MKVLIKHTKKGKKTFIHIDEADVWSGPQVLAAVIHEFLVAYKKDARPSMNLLPERFHEGSEAQQEAYLKDAQAYWLRCIDHMLYAFYWIQVDDTFGPHGVSITKELNAYKERQQGWSTVFKKYQKRIDEHQTKVKEGTRLFGEHFQSLWT